MYDLLNTDFVWSPPPILSTITLNEIEMAIQEVTVSSLFAGIPCHSQAVERTVKLVSESSKAAADMKAEIV